MKPRVFGKACMTCAWQRVVAWFRRGSLVSVTATSRGIGQERMPVCKLSGRKGQKNMAEREGFEPSIEFPLYTLSKRAPSTARPSLRRGLHLFSLP